MKTFGINLKWFAQEFLNMYSAKKSHFSKKRIESGLAFIIAQWGMIYYLNEHHSTLSMGEFLLWSSVEFAVSGYMLNQIQKEKIAADAAIEVVETPKEPTAPICTCQNN